MFRAATWIFVYKHGVLYRQKNMKPDVFDDEDLVRCRGLVIPGDAASPFDMADRREDQGACDESFSSTWTRYYFCRELVE